MTLRLAADLELPDETVTDTGAILARRGAGKTYTAMLMAEQMLEGGHQICAIDPTGVWWGLRSSATGKSAGYEVVVLGGDEADVPLEPTAGELVADLIVDARISCVLDLSQMRKGERTRFLTAFAERLFHRKSPREFRTPLHLFIDEAHAFVPQRPQQDQARMLGAGEDLVQMGRSRGIGVTLISQRPAVVNKNVLSQVAGVIALQLTAPQDRKALDAWLEEVADQDQRREFIAGLSALGKGEAIVWYPHLGIFQRASIAKRRTFDSSATPAVGEQAVMPAARADVDLSELEAKMAETIERARATDPALLQRRIRELEQRGRETDDAHERTLQELDAARAEIMERPAERVLIPVLSDEDRAVIQESREAVGIVAQRLNGLERLLEKAADGWNTLDAHICEAEGRQPAVAARPAPIVRSPRQAAPPPGPVEARPAVDVELTPAARRILETLARHHPMVHTLPQIGTLCGLKTKGGHFQQTWGMLRGQMLVEDTPAGWKVTQRGLDVAGVVPENPQAPEELVAMWRPKLGDTTTQMLELVIGAGAPVDREYLADAMGISAGGGHFQGMLGKLVKNGLVVKDGQVYRPADILL